MDKFMEQAKVMVAEGLAVDTNILKAIKLAIEAHSGQVDKAGRPYIEHVLRVSSKGKTVEEKIVGALHDTLEDTDLAPIVIEASFGKHILEAVQAITHRTHEPLAEYLQRVVQNDLARAVKEYDVFDNMDPERMSELDQATQDRLLNKYNRVLRALAC